MIGRLASMRSVASRRSVASQKHTRRALALSCLFLVPAAAFTQPNFSITHNESTKGQSPPKEKAEDDSTQEEFWKGSEGSKFLEEILAKSLDEKPNARSIRESLKGSIGNVKDSMGSLLNKVNPKESSDGYFGLAAAFSSMVAGGKDKEDALDTIMSQARNAEQSSEGVVDKTGFSELLSVMQENSEKIQKVLKDEFGDIDFSYFTPTALWYYLEYEDERKNPSWKRQEHRFHQGIDVPMVEELNDSLKLSELSYSDTLEELKEGLKTAKVPLEVISYQLESEPGQPSHFVAVKEGQSWWSRSLEVVIVVRGTKTFSDAITDALMDAADYRGGKAHAGILDSGMWLAEKHADLFQELLKISNKSKIKLTLIGHSLGAGAAAIAGMELKDKKNMDVTVVGFGCPALLSKELSESTADYITTVICDSDVVPRMSGATIANVALDIMEYDRYPKLLRDAQHAIEALGKYSPKIATEARREAAMDYIDSVSDSLKEKLLKPKTEERVSPVLCPPGRCVHFYRDGHSVSGSIAPCTFFGEIDITRTMVDDHLIPTGYGKIFLDLMRIYHDDEHFRFQDRGGDESSERDE